MTTSARLLALLGLLQSRPGWTGPELAARLEVTERTIRNDIERLRALDYPVHADLGRAGGYRLGDSGRLPPLLLSDSEAVAVAVGLTAAGASERPGRAHPDRDRQAGARATRPAAHPGAVAAREHRRRSGQHRDERGRSRGRSRAAGRARARHPPSGGTAVLVPRRRGRGGRSVPAGQLATAVVPGRPTPTDRHLAGVPGGLAAAPGAGSGSLHRGSAAGRGLRVVRAPRRRLDRLGRARPDPGRRPGRGGARGGSTPPSGWWRPSTTSTACWSPGATAWRSWPSGSACSAWTSMSTDRRSWSTTSGSWQSAIEARCQLTGPDEGYDSPPALPVVPARTSSSWYFSAASLGALEGTSPVAASSCRARTTIDWTSMWK